MTMIRKKKIDQSIAQRAVRVKRRLLGAAVKQPDTLLIQYDTSYDGFDEEKVEDMRDEHGRNVITHQKRDSIWKRLLEAFVNPFTVVLFILAVISALTGDVPAVVIVTTMVTISGLLRFVQELRSGRAAEKLSEMVETTITAQRIIEDEGDKNTRPESVKRDIPLDEVVVGDIVHLAAGDMVPADVRILQAKDLFISQSSLTGESEPVEKFAAPVAGKPVNPLELNNLAFMGSNVLSGSATALVLAVGDDTSLGAIAHQLQEKKEPTSFEKGVNSVSWVLIRFMMVMVPIVLLVNGFTKGN